MEMISITNKSRSIVDAVRESLVGVIKSYIKLKGEIILTTPLPLRRGSEVSLIYFNETKGILALKSKWYDAGAFDIDIDDDETVLIEDILIIGSIVEKEMAYLLN